jgi:IS30 family transposase
MDKRYNHLNGEERGVILAEHRRGASLGAIGALLGRSASTIGRKLWRGRPEGDPGQPYCAQLGGDRYRMLRKRCGRWRKLVAGDRLHNFVRSKLILKRWSPEQIACRLKSMHPDDPTRLISHETIHTAICAQPKGRLKAGMIAALRQHKPARGLRRTTLAGGSIALESLRIIHRPEEVEGRLVPGHRPYGDAGIACRLTGRRSDQGRLQLLGGGRGGRTQDPLCHSHQFKRQAIDPGDRL